MKTFPVIIVLTLALGSAGYARADQPLNSFITGQQLSKITSGAANALPATTTPPSTSGHHDDDSSDDNDNRDKRFYHNRINNYVPPPVTMVSGCLEGYIPICGTSVPVPTAPLNYTLALNVPPPYIRQPFTVQCVNSGVTGGYAIIESSAVTCTLMPCVDSSVKICDRDIPIPGGLAVGTSTKMDVPSSYLAAPSPYVHASFSAQCVYNAGTQTAVYQATDTSGVSCNLFPCLSTDLKICGTAVPVEGGLPLGESIDLTVPPPYAPDHFTVQCLGSAGKAPVYQITDSSAVTCNLQRH